MEVFPFVISELKRETDTLHEFILHNIIDQKKIGYKIKYQVDIIVRLHASHCLCKYREYKSLCNSINITKSSQFENNEVLNLR